MVGVLFIRFLPWDIPYSVDIAVWVMSFPSLEDKSFVWNLATRV